MDTRKPTWLLVTLLCCVTLMIFVSIHKSSHCKGRAAIYHALTSSNGLPMLNGNTSIYFGVAMAIYARNNNDAFKLQCLTSLRSLVRQTYPHWSLILVGDGLTPRQIGLMFKAVEAAGVSPSKLIFANMEESLREIYRYANPTERWAHGGTNALNMALRLVYNISYVTHIARLDDDDYWFPDHLQNLVEAYFAYPNASFAYSQALGYLKDAAFPVAEGIGHLQLRAPAPCKLIHATTSWSVSLQLFYRHADEQRASPRYSEECCGHNPCTQGVTLPADADLWERIRGLVKTSGLVSVLVNTADIHYTGDPEKACLKKVAESNGTIADCAAVLDHIAELVNSTCHMLGHTN